jgi:hypothetical protein
LSEEGGGGGGGGGATSVLVVVDLCPEAFKEKTVKTKIIAGTTKSDFSQTDLIKFVFGFITVLFSDK